MSELEDRRREFEAAWSQVNRSVSREVGTGEAPSSHWVLIAVAGAVGITLGTALWRRRSSRRRPIAAGYKPLPEPASGEGESSNESRG